MPSKVQLYAQMADRTAEQITGSYQKWTAFLTTAARLYKYPYNEQLMIFAQRPEATACAEYDLWNIWPSTAIPVWSICFSVRPAKPTHRSGRKPLSGIS